MIVDADRGGHGLERIARGLAKLFLRHRFGERARAGVLAALWLHREMAEDFFAQLREARDDRCGFRLIGKNRVGEWHAERAKLVDDFDAAAEVVDDDDHRAGVGGGGG